MRIAMLTAVLLAFHAAPLAHAAEDIGYDPHADPSATLAAATAQARQEHKLVLLVAGGDWCIWCHYLHAFLDANEDIDRALHQVFVVAQVYFGDENENAAFFSQWPRADGYPHFWVLSSSGALVKSQPTVVLENGKKSYDKAKFAAFIESWRSAED